jgi:hypothetical protein
MTEQSGPAVVPAGWYPIEAGSPQLRWWDGTQWTDHHHLLTTGPQLVTAPAGTSSGTAWIWIFAVLPLAQLVEIPILLGFYSRILGSGFTSSSSLIIAEYAPNSGYLAIQGIGILFYGVYVVLAVFDYRALKARGVPRPFHWAWAFLSGLVYIIGRTVVVRRRTGTGMAPMWVNIVTQVIAIVGIIAATVTVLAAAVTAAQ